mmetsp:Transcript_43955/g.83941  ORF Transcript_43955/g.83941 Transcript_43955/m.83941 type:complete len:216 (+) Transcript_43955:64-711(+)|eukprot:CAMPEP_0114280196 /NCGR_PEP_ID=MMETSP0059-20121206/2308_1 /TAXON_ID=36894 /ORGANISM="Pyramimonas parkeae, Strain CCMP726" /LENGTH=215 /DNA_ID=CAMNT_0001400579 /DNA_START=226 /DNA_END=873 /DNA_ORIENTATION=+
MSRSATQSNDQELAASTTCSPATEGLLQTKRQRMSTKLLQIARERWANDIHGRGLFAPNSPTPLSLIRATLKILRPDNNSLLIDIGCGDGRWLFEACKTYGCRCMGIEVNAELAADVQRRVKEARFDNLVTVINADIKCVTELASATAVVFYGSRKGCTEIAPCLQNTLRPGTKVVSVQFHMPWKILETISDPESEFEAYVYDSPSPADDTASCR